MLKDKTVVVFGGSRGIGKSIAQACAKNGANLALASRTKAELEATSSEIRLSYDTRILSDTCDVSNLDQVQRFVDRVESELGPIHGLICASGIYGAIGPIDETSPAQWRETIEVNLIAPYHCIYAAVGRMKKRKSGRIILFSGGGQGPIANFSAYTASKGGVWRLTETLGAELEPFGVYLNAIAPGLVNTRFLDDLIQAGEAKVGRELYQKSLKQKAEGGIAPDQAADLALYLLSDESGNLAGKTISARWDDYRKFQDPSHLNKSDIFTMKRVIDLNGSTRFS